MTAEGLETEKKYDVDAATVMPDLAAIPGVGQAKLDRYGAAVIALCARGAGTEGAVRT